MEAVHKIIWYWKKKKTNQSKSTATHIILNESIEEKIRFLVYVFRRLPFSSSKLCETKEEKIAQHLLKVIATYCFKSNLPLP